MINRINTYINVSGLIGLSLSQCCTDWLKNHIQLDQIHCLFTGTKIIPNNPHSINDWIQLESRVNPTIKSMPSHAIDFIKHLFKYDKLIQPRLLNNGMVPVYRGQPINWIHKDKWIDWNKYQSANQCCPYCGTINKHFVDKVMIGSMSKSDMKQLECNECHNNWTIEINSQWQHWESTDWMTPKL